MIVTLQRRSPGKSMGTYILYECITLFKNLAIFFNNLASFFENLASFYKFFSESINPSLIAVRLDFLRLLDLANHLHEVVMILACLLRVFLLPVTHIRN